MLAACSSTDEAAGGSSSSTSGQIAPGSQEDLVANVGDRVFFDTDKSSLSDEARATLQRQAAWMELYPNLTFTLEGHADERGTREYNLALGGRRANAAKDYLVSLGVDGGRLNTVSYGKERPVCLESNENCWAQNRRAVTVIASGAAS
jgi:peptidoglycan-associated lipoprotein